MSPPLFHSVSKVVQLDMNQEQLLQSIYKQLGRVKKFTSIIDEKFMAIKYIKENPTVDSPAQTELERRLVACSGG